MSASLETRLSQILPGKIPYMQAYVPRTHAKSQLYILHTFREIESLSGVVLPSSVIAARVLVATDFTFKYLCLLLIKPVHFFVPFSNFMEFQNMILILALFVINTFES